MTGTPVGRLKKIFILAEHQKRRDFRDGLTSEQGNPSDRIHPPLNRRTGSSILPGFRPSAVDEKEY